MNIFGGNSPWGSSPFSGRRLGQSPLVLGPSSWGAGMIPVGGGGIPPGRPPFWGEWGVVDEEGRSVDGGRVGPFNTSQEAFDAAGKEASDHGVKRMPLDGFAQVRDSNGNPVGPII